MLKTYADGKTSATYLYDNLNRKISETVNYGNFQLKYGYAYYKNGLKKNIIMPDGTSYEYTYDNANQLTGISSISYSDYQWNKPKSVKLPGGVSKTYSYDSLMRLQTIAVKNPAQNVLMQYGYTYDKMDNIRTKQTEHGNYGYVYDSLYRLTSADNPGVNDEAYTYDNAGNRLTANGISGNWTYNANNELRAFGNSTFDYDRNGNMSQKSDGSQAFTYIYDVENRLVRVEKKSDGSVVANYYYDPFGRRLWKEVSGVRTYFLYADEGLIGEYDASGAFVRTYAYKPNSMWTTDPVFMKQRSGNYFYHNDRLGTPVQMTDISGNLVWSAKYDSFGKTEIGASLVTNNLRLPGQYFDAETGLYYNYFRYYDPNIGRYVETDPLGFGNGLYSMVGSKCSTGYRYDNLYVYVSNNPLNFIDPRGQWKVGIETPCIPFPPPLSLVGYQGSVSTETKSCCDGTKKKKVTSVEACLKLCSIRSGLGSLSVSTSSPDAIKSCPKEGEGGGKIFAECHTSIWKSEVSAEYPDWTPKFNVEYTRGENITINTNGEINVVLAMPSDNGCSG
ncbi:MAG: hypothetical protein HC887_12185, partial [Desulfobacteraceae bacterium]|nr:hypothetical protein [Desulfobacteraceae bacterium]